MSRSIVVVPCYNEAIRLDLHAIREFSRDHADPRFLFVDDGSTDGTGTLLEQLHLESRERFLVCRLRRNVGKAEAVRQGLLRAFEERPDYVGYWDADLATPLAAIPTFSSILDFRPDIDMVFGARVCLHGRSVTRKPIRHYLGRVFATAASLALGVTFYDTQCGAKLFRATPEVQALFDAPFHTRWIFDVEIVARAIAARRGSGRPAVERAIYEFPLHEWRDVAGSKIKPLDWMRAFFGLVSIRWNYRRTTAKSECRLGGVPHTRRPHVVDVSTPESRRPHVVDVSTPESISAAP
jgi:dolichyl-phosphate beta-glucosyltransferase